MAMAFIIPRPQRASSSVRSIFSIVGRRKVDCAAAER
jgi:hypothetical protein